MGDWSRTADDPDASTVTVPVSEWDDLNRRAAPLAGGPFHIVNAVTGKHLGPFSTEFDCALARNLATPDWARGTVMDRETFERHLHG